MCRFTGVFLGRLQSVLPSKYAQSTGDVLNLLLALGSRSCANAVLQTGQMSGKYGAISSNVQYTESLVIWNE